MLRVHQKCYEKISFKGRKINGMNVLFKVCIALSFGVILGMAGGIIKKSIKKKSYTEKQIARSQKIWKIGSRIMMYLTCLFLIIGFIWCVYFLILGAIYPEQIDYANNMSEMITSVLTVVSIAFAFYEFIRRK